VGKTTTTTIKSGTVLDAHRFYTAHDELTDPGPHAARLEALPRDLTALHAAIDGILVHVWKVRRDRPDLPAPRPREVFVRRVARLLDAVERLGPSPLDVARPIERRAVVDCRSFAVFLCAILRHRGVPARPRCGFATYLEQTHWQDHWACEYWDAPRGRWVTEDADARRHDVPPTEFVTAARAWTMCRSDPGIADRFGYDRRQRGAWAVRANLVRDFAALNGFPGVSGDAWGLALAKERDVTDADRATLDAAARLAGDDERFDGQRDLYHRTPSLRVPDEIAHFDYLTRGGGVRLLAWRDEP
jgi:hypothetical protein